MHIVAVWKNFGYIILQRLLQNIINGVKTMEGQNPKFGFTAFAENWNGRLAMIGFVAALITEYVTGEGVLHFLGLM